jgi:hypothetical protein
MKKPQAQTNLRCGSCVKAWDPSLALLVSVRAAGELDTSGPKQKRRASGTRNKKGRKRLGDRCGLSALDHASWRDLLHYEYRPAT